MVKIIGVRFRNTGKVYYFDPLDLEPARGSRVIVETARGIECGKVVLTAREVDESKVVQPLRPVIRLATEEDVRTEWENYAREKDAYRICQQKIREHELDMKLVQAEYTFDNKKVLFYFTADGRIDFRDLVKDLASVFKTRIELRQIGVRDETKMLGGIGICGRPLCCSTYLSDFAPVSIKMAKEQNLSLNPTKISGACGRLMCCLKNEEDTYEYLNQRLPGIGDIVETPDGKIGDVHAVNVLRQRVRVIIEDGDDKEIEEYPAEEIQVLSKKRKGGGKSREAALREAREKQEERLAADKAAEVFVRNESETEILEVLTESEVLVAEETVFTEETDILQEAEPREGRGRRRGDRDRERRAEQKNGQPEKQETESREGRRRRDRNRKPAALESAAAGSESQEPEEKQEAEPREGRRRRRDRNRRAKEKQNREAQVPAAEGAEKDRAEKTAGGNNAAGQDNQRRKGAAAPEAQKRAEDEGGGEAAGGGEKRRRRRNRRPRRNKGAAEGTDGTVGS